MITLLIHAEVIELAVIIPISHHIHFTEEGAENQRLNDIPNVTQLGSGRAMIRTQVLGILLITAGFLLVFFF